VTARGDFKKIRRRAEDQGWRVEKRKEYLVVLPTRPPAATLQGGRHAVLIAVAGQLPWLHEEKWV
jgi:hypothetical protein